MSTFLWNFRDFVDIIEYFCYHSVIGKRKRWPFDHLHHEDATCANSYSN